MEAGTQLLMNYAIVFFLGIFIIGWFLRGFLLSWFIVKRSGGNKILVHIASPLNDYYKAGSVDNGFLRYRARFRKDNPKPDRSLYVGDIRHFSYRAFGVNVVDVDDEKGVVWGRYTKLCDKCGNETSNYVAMSGHNAEAEDEALKTALIKPDSSDAYFTTRTFQLIVVAGFVLTIIGFIIVVRAIGGLDGHLKLVYDSISAMQSGNFTGV